MFRQVTLGVASVRVDDGIYLVSYVFTLVCTAVINVHLG